MQPIEFELEEDELLLSEDEQNNLKAQKFNNVFYFYNNNFVIEKIIACSDRQNILINELTINSPYLIVLRDNKKNEHGFHTIWYIFGDGSGYFTNANVAKLIDTKDYCVYDIIILKYQKEAKETVIDTYKRKQKEAKEKKEKYYEVNYLKRYVAPFEEECKKMHRENLIGTCYNIAFKRQNLYDKKDNMTIIGHGEFTREDNLLIKNLTLFGPTYVRYYVPKDEKIYGTYADENGYYCSVDADDSIVEDIWYLKYTDEYDIKNAPNGQIFKKIVDEISPSRL